VLREGYFGAPLLCHDLCHNPAIPTQIEALAVFPGPVSACASQLEQSRNEQLTLGVYLRASEPL
jgi:hypothetical protein